MTKISSLFLAFLLLAFSAVAQAETSIPALMTGPENLVRPGQAVTTTVVTAHGSQYGVTLRLDEIRYEDYRLIILFSLTQGEVLPAEDAYANYLEQRFGSGESIFPDEQMALHPDAFTLFTEMEEEYPYTADGFSLTDSEDFAYEPLFMVPGEEIRFRMNFSFVDSLKGARLRFQDSGMFQVFAMRPDLMEDSIAWLALE